MGYSKSDKAETHTRIVKVAAKRFRERGLEGIGVADVMKRNGVTVGGFYKHSVHAINWSWRRSRRHSRILTFGKSIRRTWRSFFRTT